MFNIFYIVWVFFVLGGFCISVKGYGWLLEELLLIFEVLVVVCVVVYWIVVSWGILKLLCKWCINGVVK